MVEKKKRKIRISFEKLKEAFNFSSDDVTHYLNIEKGQIAMHSNFSGAFDEDGNEIHESNPFYKNIYIEIPGILYYEAYRDMERFADQVKSESVRKKLKKAISSKGAFRMFTYVLMDYPEERENWFKFQEECVRNRIFDWLDDNHLELEEP
jgi:hypothetical protein